MSQGCKLDGKRFSGAERPHAYLVICFCGFWHTDFKPIVSAT
jgi:hypothetical protein